MDKIIAQDGILKIFCPACGQKLDVSMLPAFSHAPCPVCGNDITIPRVFDGYLLEEVVGTGGMATVYRALDLALERTVAVKILHENMGDELNQKFLSEAKMAAKVTHPSIISIYTCAICGDTPYIVMEFMDGMTLEKLLEKKESLPLDIPQVCEWFGNLAAALERAEKNGIIHHDIKPANMLLNRDGIVKIGDFGIAETLEQSSGKKQERVWGSPNYISPEKAMTGIEDHTGDIYSLGASFYHLLTGQVPFPNTASLQELLSCRIHRDPLAPHLVRKDVPVELSAFVLKMMHRVSGMRPSYGQIRQFLQDYVRKNFLNRVRSATPGVALIAESFSSSSSGSAGMNKLSQVVPEQESPRGSSGERQKKNDVQEAAVPEAESAALQKKDGSFSLRLWILTAIGKLLFLFFFFLFVFTVTRWFIGSENPTTGEWKKSIVPFLEGKK